MLSWIGRILLLGLVSLLGLIYWKLEQIRQPIELKEIPRWQIRELNAEQWEIQSVSDPERKTTAWFRGNPQGLRCDTSVLLTGVQQGKNLLDSSVGLNDLANTVAMEHPIREYIRKQVWRSYGVAEWWNVGELIRLEMLHTLGALQALLRHTNGSLDGDNRFTEQVVLAGGSFGAPFTAALTSSENKHVSGLLLIYAFTDFEGLFNREFVRQGRIHYKIPPEPESLVAWSKDLGLQTLASSLAGFLSTLLEYGEMEAYLPNIRNTPIHFINGRNDRLAPQSSYDLLWNAAPEPKSELWLPGDHINPGDPVALLQVSEHMYEWGKAQGLRDCEELDSQ
jgi:hypothetical protein